MACHEQSTPSSLFTMSPLPWMAFLLTLDLFQKFPRWFPSQSSRKFSGPRASQASQCISQNLFSWVPQRAISSLCHTLFCKLLWGSGGSEDIFISAVRLLSRRHGQELPNSFQTNEWMNEYITLFLKREIKRKKTVKNYSSQWYIFKTHNSSPRKPSGTSSRSSYSFVSLDRNRNKSTQRWESADSRFLFLLEKFCHQQDETHAGLLILSPSPQALLHLGNQHFSCKVHYFAN